MCKEGGGDVGGGGTTTPLLHASNTGHLSQVCIVGGVGGGQVL